MRYRWTIGLLTLAVFLAGVVWAGCNSVRGSSGAGATQTDGRDDRDEDGLSNDVELALGTDPDNPDTDSDGLSDGDEVAGDTSPLAADSDLDGIPDAIDPEPTAAETNEG